MAYRLVGDIDQRSGDRAGAVTAWTAGLAQLPAQVTERPWEMNERAQLLSRLGRNQEAAPVKARLDAIGYRSLP
jgi:hypothetical protein